MRIGASQIAWQSGYHLRLRLETQGPNPQFLLLLNAADFYDLISGRRRGARASATRGLLACAEIPYAIAVALRNRWYDYRPSSATRVPAPVVSVGNLTVGGTGKTPMVKWIARRLRGQSRQIAILSRGYGAQDGKKNDEALELEDLLPQVPHLQGSDRVALAQAAINRHDSQVLLLDDGFQHRRLARDLDIVLLDATAPFGYGHLLPRGALRESVSGLRRADVVCLTRATAASPAERQAIRDRVLKIAPQITWCEATHAPRSLLSSSGEEQSIDQLQGRRVAAFSGIGNPAAFRATLETVGAEIVSWRELPDHHNYSSQDIASLADSIASTDAELVVCTHKDLVKLRQPQLANLPLLAVVVEIEFLNGESKLAEKLDTAISSNSQA